MREEFDENGDWLPLTVEEYAVRERRERRALALWLAIVAAGALLIAATLGWLVGRFLR